MTRLALALIFGTSLALSLLVTVPLEFVLGLFSAENAGLSARAVSGSIWSGHVQELRLRGVSLGDVEGHLDPIALLTGVRRLQIHSARGSGVIVQGRANGVDHVNVSVDFAELGLKLPFQGTLRLTDATLLFQDGRCSRAMGRVSTDAFRRNTNGQDVAGTLACDGDVAVARLLGRASDIEIAMTFRIEASGRYSLETRAMAANSAMRGALVLAGFSESADGLVRIDQGLLGT